MKIALVLVLLLLPVTLPAQAQQADTLRRNSTRRMQPPEHRSHTEWHYHRGSKRVPSSNDTVAVKRK